MFTYNVSNDIVHFPDTNETFVCVYVKDGDSDVRTELWTQQEVEDLTAYATE